MFNWRRIAQDLDHDDEGCYRHLQAIKAMIASERDWTLHTWLHHDLTVLDDKTSCILAVNSIAIAAITFYLGARSEHSVISNVLATLALLTLLCSLLSLLRIPFVFWSSTTDFESSDEMFCELLMVRNARSKIVRASVILISYAVMIFLCAFLVDSAMFARNHVSQTTSSSTHRRSIHGTPVSRTHSKKPRTRPTNAG
jgi:hypothetical protein